MKKLLGFSKVCLSTIFFFLLSLTLCATASFGQTAKVIAAAGGGGHSVILKDDGSVWTFGRNNHGQLGSGDTANRSIPVRVRDSGGFGYLTGITAIAAGENHTVALKNDGTVWAWGDNSHGQLGIGNTEDKTTPVRVSGLAGLTVTAVAAGGNHTLALISNGTVWAWGDNSHGQLGDNTVTDRSTPVMVNGLANVTAVAAGEKHSAALINGGTMRTWGANNYGQLGNESDTDSRTPIQVKCTVNGQVQAMDTKSITLAATASSTNDYYKGMRINISGGWQGTGIITKYTGSTRKATVTWANPPTEISGNKVYYYAITTLSSITDIACGNNHTLAINSDGTAWLWGYNGFGQLGDGTTVSKSVPTRASGLSDICGIDGGEWHSIFLKNDGTVYACGRGDHKQAGSGSAKISTASQVKEYLQLLLLTGGIITGEQSNQKT